MIPKRSTENEVLIVGAGPAGLQAALVLGRACRRVVIVDDDRPRNGPAEGVHGLLGLEGLSPLELRARGRAELEPYDVTILRDRVDRLQPSVLGAGGYLATLASGQLVHAKKVLLATGMADMIPKLPGFAELWGKCVFTCPYCHGWEWRGRRLGVVSFRPDAVEQALGMLSWSTDVTLFTGGRVDVGSVHSERLARAGVKVYSREPLAWLEAGPGDTLAAVRLATGERVPQDALFVHTGYEQKSDLAQQLGCSFESNGTVCSMPGLRGPRPGLFLAGDVTDGMQWVVVAMAEGAQAAWSILAELRQDAEAAR